MLLNKWSDPTALEFYETLEDEVRHNLLVTKVFRASFQRASMLDYCNILASSTNSAHMIQ